MRPAIGSLQSLSPRSLDRDDRQTALESGYSTHLAKPIDARQLARQFGISCTSKQSVDVLVATGRSRESLAAGRLSKRRRLTSCNGCDGRNQLFGVDWLRKMAVVSGARALARSRGPA